MKVALFCGTMLPNHYANVHSVRVSRRVPKIFLSGVGVGGRGADSVADDIFVWFKKML